MTTPDQIAAGASPTISYALKNAEPDGALGRCFVRFYQVNHRTRRALVRQGLAFTVWSGVCLTPLGQSVRAILKDQADVK